jgi:hypothetical protein
MKQKIPQLKPLKIEASKLCLDPNNPRFVTQTSQRVSFNNILDPLVQIKTRDQMSRVIKGEIDNKISQIENSILKDGYLPVDQIYVIKIEEGKYLTIEGNRRVTAIQNLLAKEDLDIEIRNQIETLTVSEIIGDYQKKETQDGILYLLGVRHHGSLKQWTPFAQARNIFETYCNRSGLSEENFKWDRSTADDIAQALSITTDEVKERLLVYRAMRQLSKYPPIKDYGGLKDRDYSIISGALTKRTPINFSKYFDYDLDSFELSEEAIKRFDNLCWFSTGRPGGQPVVKPSEWGALGKILDSEDEDDRIEGMRQIEVEHQKPSDVYARIAAAKHPLQWEGWLMNTKALLSSVTYGESIPEKGLERLNILAALLNELSKNDISNLD